MQLAQLLPIAAPMATSSRSRFVNSFMVTPSRLLKVGSDLLGDLDGAIWGMDTFFWYGWEPPGADG